MRGGWRPLSLVHSPWGGVGAELWAKPQMTRRVIYPPKLPPHIAQKERRAGQRRRVRVGIDNNEGWGGVWIPAYAGMTLWIMKENTYQPRNYRHWIEGKDLFAFSVTEKETDLYIRAAADLQRKARRLAIKYRYQLEGYIKRNPAFVKTLEPLSVPDYAPAIVKEMVAAGQKAGVGPMAAVAGAIAEYVGRELLGFSREIIVENGGDIFIKTIRERTVGVYAGDSPLTGKIGLVVKPKDTPLGICTSSGTVGHSLSYGKADAVVVVSASAALADAAATAIGNRVQNSKDINNAIEFGRDIEDLRGIIIILGKDIGVWGDIELCETSAP